MQTNGFCWRRSAKQGATPPQSQSKIANSNLRTINCPKRPLHPREDNYPICQLPTFLRVKENYDSRSRKGQFPRTLIKISIEDLIHLKILVGKLLLARYIHLLVTVTVIRRLSVANQKICIRITLGHCSCVVQEYHEHNE